MDICTALDQTTQHAEETRQEIFSKLTHLLETHTSIEEDIFYSPLSSKHGCAAHTTHESSAKLEKQTSITTRLVKELLDLPVSNEKWMPRLSALKETIAKHVKEEEDQLFQLAQDFFKPEQLEKIRANPEKKGGRASSSVVKAS